MNAKTLMLRAALAASVAGCLGSALSPASATTIALSGLGADIGGGGPASESGPTFTNNGGRDVQTFGTTSGQFSMIESGDSVQSLTSTGTLGDAGTLPESFAAPADGAVASTVDPRVILPDGIGSVTSGNFDFTPIAALATPKAGAITAMLFAFASLGFAGYRWSRRALAPLVA